MGWAGRRETSIPSRDVVVVVDDPRVDYYPLDVDGPNEIIDSLFLGGLEHCVWLFFPYNLSDTVLVNAVFLRLHASDKLKVIWAAFAIALVGRELQFKAATVALVFVYKRLNRVDFAVFTSLASVRKSFVYTTNRRRPLAESTFVLLKIILLSF